MCPQSSKAPGLEHGRGEVPESSRQVGRRQIVGTCRALSSLVRLSKLVQRVAIAALALGSAAITYSSLVYFDDTEISPFMLEKLPLPNEELWLSALKVHV